MNDASPPPIGQPVELRPPSVLFVPIPIEPELYDALCWLLLHRREGNSPAGRQLRTWLGLRSYHNMNLEEFAAARRFQAQDKGMRLAIEEAEKKIRDQLSGGAG